MEIEQESCNSITKCHLIHDFHYSVEDKQRTSTSTIFKSHNILALFDMIYSEFVDNIVKYGLLILLTVIQQIKIFNMNDRLMFLMCANKRKIVER